MNKQLKLGIALIAAGVVMGLASKVAWPVIESVSYASPAKFPLLIAIGAAVLVWPNLILVGLVKSIYGAVTREE